MAISRQKYVQSGHEELENKSTHGAGQSHAIFIQLLRSLRAWWERQSKMKKWMFTSAN